MGSLPSIEINNFIGVNKTKDYLSLIPGQLMTNRNYLYMSNGGLYERGGGALLKAPPAAGALYSLANYKGNSGTEFLITNQGTDAYYYATSAWNALSLTLTTSLKTRWAEAGFGANRAIYGVNGTDAVIKILDTAGTPVGSSVGSSPTTLTDIILHKNRLFGVAGDLLYFTEALAFDTWNTSVNTIEVAPGKDGLCQALAIWVDALFILKERGIYVLPNADDITPKLNWVILRTDSDVGTLSPDTVQETKRGLFFLANDASIRLMGPTTSYSTGEYTLGDSGSPVISHAIESVLRDDLDRSRIAHACAIVKEDLYIISWQSDTATSNYNDVTYFADTTKWMPWTGIPILQPYWGEFTVFNYQFYALQTVSGRQRLYGVKGVSTIGQVHETLNDTVHNDNSSGIDAYAILGWMSLDKDSVYKNIKQVYMIADTETWNIACKFNVYKYRQSLPADSEGINRTYSTSSITGVGVVGSAIVGTSIVGNIGVSSSRFRFSLKGYYFKAEFRNQNADEFTRINKLIVYYRQIKNK